MIKNLLKILFGVTIVTLFFSIAIMFLQYAAFFVTQLGWDARSTAGMWGGMLFLLTIKWIESKMQ